MTEPRFATAITFAVSVAMAVAIYRGAETWIVLTIVAVTVLALFYRSRWQQAGVGRDAWKETAEGVHRQNILLTHALADLLEAVNWSNRRPGRSIRAAAVMTKVGLKVKIEHDQAEQRID